MRIAVVGSKGIPGRHGVEVVVDNVTSRLAAAGHKVSVFSYSHYSGDLAEYKGCTIVPIRGSGNKFLEMPTHAAKSTKLLLSELRNAFDVVHIHSTDPCLFMRKIGGVFPVVATSHGRAYLRQEVDPIRKAFSRFAEKTFLEIGDVTTGVSPVDVEYYNSLPQSGKNVKYIPNGLPQLESDYPFPQNKGIEAGKYILFSAGRIIPSKGLHLLQEALQSIETELPLAIVGGKGFDEKYYRRVQHALKDKCIWLGFLRDKELYGIYKHARIAVFPSLYEAQSMTLLEFLALGVDIVFSDLPENTAITQGIGIPFKSGNSKSLASSLCKALSGECYIDTDARRAILQKHDWDDITKSYINCYEEAISRHK